MASTEERDKEYDQATTKWAIIRHDTIGQMVFQTDPHTPAYLVLRIQGPMPVVVRPLMVEGAARSPRGPCRRVVAALQVVGRVRDVPQEEHAVRFAPVGPGPGAGGGIARHDEE